MEESPFRIAEWQVQPMRNRIVGPSGAVALEPRLIRILTYLAAHAEEVVSRDALMEAVWEDTVISESSLTSSISELRRLLGDDPHAPRFIETIRKRGYRLIAPVRLLSEADAKNKVEELDAHSMLRLHRSEAQRSSSMSSWMLGAMVAIVLFSSALVAAWQSGHAPSESRITPLTTLPGVEIGPVFSPDGSRVAFVRLDGEADRADIYVQTVEDGVAKRLTNIRGAALYPAWSPDGERIAFVWNRADACSIYLTSSLGGAIRKLVDLNHTLRQLDWAPQGDWLVFSYAAADDVSNRIYRLHTTTLALEALTNPPMEAADVWPLFSPDGTQVAFRRTTSAASADLFLMPFASGAPPQQLTFADEPIFGHDWTPRGKRILFAALREGQQGLWEIKASGGTPRLVRASAQNETAYLRTAPQANRLTYVAWQTDVNLWALPGPLAPTRTAPQRLPVASTYTEGHADYAPNGEHIVFVSDRSGAAELWRANLRTQETMRLTSLGNATLTRPQWSPDGQHIAFEMRTDGQAGIYLIDAAGGRVEQLTASTYDEVGPSWSSDGRFLYFSSNREGMWQIWKRELTTGMEIQVTQDGGYMAHEAPSGASLYLTRDQPPVIYEYRLADSTYHARADALTNQDADSFTVGKTGLYYTRWDVQAGVFRFYVVPHGEAVPVELAHFPRNLYYFYYAWGIAVSPDEQTILVSHIDQGESNLMLADNLY